MRNLRTIALAVLTTLLLAGLAVAAQPKDGTFKGSVDKTCGGNPCTAKLSLKVKNGKVTKLTYKVGLFKSGVTPDKPIKVSKKGKFSYRSKVGPAEITTTLSGKFTTKSKVKGTFQITSADGSSAVSKTKFTLKRK